MGSTPPSNLLLGAASTGVAGGTLPGNTIGGQFAGLLGQPGKQSDLALLSTNPTGDIEASPQAVDIASLGQLPGLAAYIDQPVSPVLKNQVSLAASAENTIDSKKAAVTSQLAALNKANISKDSAQIASDIVNQQEFQSAIKNIEAQKQADGNIKLTDLPTDMKAATLSAQETQDVMAKATAMMADKTAQNNKAVDTANNQATAQAQNTDVAVQDTGDTTTQSNTQGESDLASKLKTDALKMTKGTKDASAFKVDAASVDATAANHAQTAINHIKDIKVDIKTSEVAQSAAHQVEVKIAQMVKDGVDMVRIKLHPEELGKIDIQMDVDSNGRTAIRIVADKVETLEMLRKDSSSLERALKDTGVKTDAGGMQFSLRDQNQQQQNFAAWDHANTHSYAKSQVNDNYLKAANVNEYTLTINPQKDGLNILA